MSDLEDGNGSEWDRKQPQSSRKQGSKYFDMRDSFRLDELEFPHIEPFAPEDNQLQNPPNDRNVPLEQPEQSSAPNDSLSHRPYFVEFDRISEFFYYLEDQLMVNSRDPILSIFSAQLPSWETVSSFPQEQRISFYNQMEEQNQSNQSNKHRGPEYVRNFKIDRQEEQAFDSWFIQFVQYHHGLQQELRTYSQILERCKIEPESPVSLYFSESLDRPEDRIQILAQKRARIYPLLWQTLQHEILYPNKQVLTLMREFRKKLQSVKNLLSVLENNIPQMLNISEENKDKKKVICKLCWQQFENGKMLGGHVSKKHPGSSHDYKIRQFLRKAKKIERQRRAYFSEGKKVKKKRGRQARQKEQEYFDEIYDGEEEEDHFRVASRQEGEES